MNKDVPVVEYDPSLAAAYDEITRLRARAEQAERERDDALALISEWRAAMQKQQDSGRCVWCEADLPAVEVRSHVRGCVRSPHRALRARAEQAERERDEARANLVGALVALRSRVLALAEEWEREDAVFVSAEYAARALREAVEGKP